jgi:hypothetical protein
VGTAVGRGLKDSAVGSKPSPGAGSNGGWEGAVTIAPVAR